MSDSSTRRLTRRRSTRVQKSASDLKSPALRARGDDRLDRALAHVLDRQQAEADGVALDGEVEARRVHVGRAHLDAQPAALGDGRGNLLGRVAHRGQHAGHVLDRVVRLEIRGLVGDQAVARGMGLVEAVALERLECLEHGIDRLRWHTALSGAAGRTSPSARGAHPTSSCGWRSRACPPPAR